MPAGPQPLQLIMAPFPEGWSGDLDQQWQQAAQLLMGSVIVSGSTTPTRLYFSFPTPWPAGWKGDINKTWAKGVSLLVIQTSAAVIPLTTVNFPDGFQGNLNETWQQGITQITGLVP
jgi:hypothetical protein